MVSRTKRLTTLEQRASLRKKHEGAFRMWHQRRANEIALQLAPHFLAQAQAQVPAQMHREALLMQHRVV
jgi:hypothetical protein